MASADDSVHSTKDAPYQLLFTTTNTDKVADFKIGFGDLGLPIDTVEIDVPEIQADWLDLIQDKAGKVEASLSKEDLMNTFTITEDTVFECGKEKIPGPATKKFIKACAGKLHMIPPLLKCGATQVVYRCSASVRLPNGETIALTAITVGHFVEKRTKEEGCSGKGLIDTQFVPDDDPDQRTISQMPLADRMKYHPRFKLIRLIIEELQKRFSF